MAEARPRVRHLLKGLGPGGAERLVLAQVSLPPPGSPEAKDPGTAAHEAPDRRPVYDVVYLLEHKDHLATDLECVGVTTHCLRAAGTVGPGWIFRLRRLLLDDPVDIVHVHSPLVAAVTRVVVRSMPRARRPVLVGTEHNRWPRHRRPTRWANHLTYRWQDVSIAVSDDVRSTMTAGIAGDTIVVTHGIDIAAVREAADRERIRAELGLSPSAVLVVCVANLRREKALDVFVAAAEIAHRRSPHLEFALIGQGPQADELETLVEASPVKDHFAILGYRPDAPAVVSGADLFTLTSRHEGLPVALMEALALGCPVVATAAGGVPEAVGEAGVIVDVDDVDGLATAYAELADDPDRRVRMARAAREASVRFSRERAVAEIEAIYERALEERALPDSARERVAAAPPANNHS